MNDSALACVSGVGISIGTGAALRHYEETGYKYPLAVKLGTITASGADVFSYAPDESCMVRRPEASAIGGMAKRGRSWPPTLGGQDVEVR